MKQPWLKFYPADWRGDLTLGPCSLAARGLWMEMLCIMSDAIPRGSLVKDGEPYTAKRLAAVARASVKDVEKLLAELEAEGVFSRDENGTIYSRRMRRDVEKEERDKANGRNGGNPNLKPKDKLGVNPKLNGVDKAQKPEARSQKPDAADAASGSGGSASLEAECRRMVEPEPVMLAQDFHLVAALLEEGATEDDIRTGIAEALEKRSDPKHRYRSWSQLAPWCRTAAKNRLSAGPRASAKSRARGPDDPNDPMIELPGGCRRRVSFVRKAVAEWRRDPKTWDWATFGVPPDSPGSAIPKHLLGDEQRELLHDG